MAVSKRTRFEILRRDNHTCRYCGATAPDVKLTVDHVVPRAIGGTDEPSNLVTACAACNAGKASTSPDEGLVADVRDDALRYAELTRQAYAVLVEQLDNRDDYVEQVEDIIVGDRWIVPRDWENSITRWFEMGVPVEIVVDAAKRASRNTTISSTGRFKYFCGIVWNQVSTVAAEVPAKAALDGAWMTKDQVDLIRVKEFYDGRREAVQICARFAEPAFLVEEFIDRFKVTPTTTTMALVFKP